MNIATILIIIATGGGGALAPSPTTTLMRFSNAANCARVAMVVSQRHQLSSRPGNILAFCVAEQDAP